MKRKARSLLVVACVLAAAAVAGLWVAGDSLSAPANHAVGAPPADLPAGPVEFASESGSTLRGWLLPGRAGRGAVVLMHGVRSDRTSMSGRARFLNAAGYAVLLFDFQAHGESPGAHITFGHLEGRDARAAVRFVRERLPGERVGVIGVSMGGAAAILAEPPLEADAFVLEMVYPTIDEAIADRLRMRLGRWAGALAPLLSMQLRPRIGVGADRLRPVERVASLPGPKLFIAGAEDRHTTLTESRRLYEAAEGPKELWVVEGAAHTDLHALAGNTSGGCWTFSPGTSPKSD
jgi:fermentation-respiration switch protein FrsA (DUF1100 family)